MGNRILKTVGIYTCVAINAFKSIKIAVDLVFSKIEIKVPVGLYICWH